MSLPLVSRLVLRPVVSAAAALTCLVAGGCAAPAATDDFFGVVTPYRVDIIQGNVVTREQLAAIRPGLRRDQVRNVLGTPLLSSAFHADRWDYVFTIRRQGTEPQRRSIVLIFEGDVLKSVEAPELPGEREFVASISKRRDEPAERVLELTDAQRSALPRPAAAPAGAASAAEPSAPPRSNYPPLE